MKNSKLIETKKILLQEIIHKSEKNLKSHLFHIFVKGLNATTLLFWDRLHMFWYVDGVIRLVGLPSEPDINPCVVYEEGGELAAKFNPSLGCDKLAKLYISTGDANSMALLLHIWVIWKIIREEILQRFNAPDLKMGKAFLDHIDEPNDLSRGENLLKTTRGQMQSWHRKQGPKWLKAQKYDPEKNKKLPPFPSLKISLLLPSKVGNENIETPEDNQNEILKTIYECYEEFKKSIKLGELADIPYSLLIKFRPINPVWDKYAPQILQLDIEDAFKTYLPILNGGVEKIPLKIIDNFRDKSRKYFKKIESDWVSLKGEIPKTLFDKEVTFTTLSKRESQGHPLSKVEYDRGSREKPTKAEEEFKKGTDPMKLIEPTLRGKIKGKQFNKAIQAFNLMKDGKTEKEACRISGLPERSLRSYLKVVRDKLIKN